MSHPLKYKVLLEPFAVCRLGADTAVPDWSIGAGFASITRSPAELSIVCHENRVPPDIRSEGGWVALKLEGPFPFSMTGVLASFIQPLAEAKIPIFAVSTFDTDYVLVKRESLGTAHKALQGSGHLLVND